MLGSQKPKRAGHPEGCPGPVCTLYARASLRAAAARHHFQTLDFLAHGFVEDGVGQEDQSVRAGVRVVILIDFAWAEYARLFGVHSVFSPFLWAGARERGNARRARFTKS